jgi:phosphatidylglycerophosphate synthase
VTHAAARYSPRPLTPGERWTADALAELRRGRHRPRAWAVFIRRSLDRSAAARAQRPALTRQARAWGAGGALAWIAACELARRLERSPPPSPGGNRERSSPPRLAGLAWWLAVWRMLDWHLGMAEGGDGIARPRLAAADAVTLTRFWLVPALPAAARAGRPLALLVALGGTTDWLDGALARRAGRTRLGRDLDTTADLAFLTVAAAAARRAGLLPAPAAWAIAIRHGGGLALALGAVLARARRPAIRARPWGAPLRVGGLAACAAGARRSGAALVLAGCVVPPRSTAPRLSRA